MCFCASTQSMTPPSLSSSVTAMPATKKRPSTSRRRCRVGSSICSSRRRNCSRSSEDHDSTLSTREKASAGCPWASAMRTSERTRSGLIPDQFASMPPIATERPSA
ncbi:MAG: hypothetical protein AW07_04127 [Candidatus Accumulibacter sp. SK-11]|nr:MAG: hypothetical protein AW07_04127 [Candidatus Accumulibacter sp. SK-11]